MAATLRAVRAAMLIVVCVLGCDSSDKKATATVTLTGRVFGADQGKPLAFVEVRTAEGDVTKSDADGRFALQHRADAKGRVETKREGYAPVSKDAPKGDAYLELFVKDVDGEGDIAIDRGGRVRSKEGAVVVSKDSVVGKDGRAPDKAHVDIALPDPRKPGGLASLPGNFEAKQGAKEGKLSAESPMHVSARDGEQKELALRSDKSVDATFPARRADSPREGRLFHFDAAEQKWLFVKKVEIAINKNRAPLLNAQVEPEEPAYHTTLDRLGWWAVGDFFDALTCVRACVVDESGKVVPFARAVATGVDHFTQLTTYADENGCFALDVRANAQISISVQAMDGAVSPTVINTDDLEALVSVDPSQCKDLGKLTLEQTKAGECPLGFRACGDACVDVRADAVHCGSCDAGCEGSAGRELSCIDGVCTCTLGQRACSESEQATAYCAAVRTDDRNCGDCNIVCESGGQCLEGLCAASSDPDAGMVDGGEMTADGGVPMRDGGMTPAEDGSVASGSPALTLSPGTQAFGPTLPAQMSAAFSFTIQNAGDGPATGCSAPTLTGAHAVDFTIVQDGCSTSDLGPSATCVVRVSASPSADGERTATLSRSCTQGGTVASAANGLFVNRPHFLFVTSVESDGNLGGLTGADNHCTTVAASGSMSRALNLRWKALLSVSGTVDARDRVRWTGPVFDVRNLLATRMPTTWPWSVDGTNPTDARLLAASENGQSVGSYVWTGTHDTGQAQGSDCRGWTSNSPDDSGHAGETGNFASSSAWISSFSNGCSDTFFALLCVSDGPAP